MTTLSDALAAYRICAQAEGKSPKTVRWIMSSMHYFGEFLGVVGLPFNDGRSTLHTVWIKAASGVDSKLTPLLDTYIVSIVPINGPVGKLV